MMKNEEAIQTLNVMQSSYAHIRNSDAEFEALETAKEALCSANFNGQAEMVPLTLEQLRGIVGQPVWVKVIGITDIRCDGWCEVEFKDKNTPNEIVCVWWPGSEVEDIAKSEDYGKTWVCYAYPPAHIGGPCHACGYGGKHLDSPPCTTCPAHPKTPAHIDREAWKPCEKCVGCGNCNYFLYDDDESPCDKCLRGSTDEKPYPEFSPIAFCKHCGRPLTPEARAIQEKRLRG